MRSLKNWPGVLLGVAVMMVVAGTISRAAAQTTTDWAVYGTGTGAKLRFQNTGVIYGGTIGFYGVKQAHGIGVGVDARGVMLGGTDTAGGFTDRRLDEGLVSARASYTRGALTPYAEVGFGLGYFRGGVSTNRQDKSSAALVGMVGADWRIRGNWDWRVVEVGYDRLKGQFGAVHPVTVSTGVVLHF
jgi:hypothetical protein